MDVGSWPWFVASDLILFIVIMKMLETCFGLLMQSWILITVSMIVVSLSSLVMVKKCLGAMVNWVVDIYVLNWIGC